MTTTSPSPNSSRASTAQRWTTFLQGVYFVMGFGVFVVGFLGLIGTVLGEVFYNSRDILRYIGGTLLIVFGLHTLGIIKIPLLYADTRKGLGGASRGASALQSLLTGLAFGAGWSPCIGPFLGTIMALGASAGSVGQRLFLLTLYVLGLGVPFLLVALLADRATPLLATLKRNMRWVEWISGLLIISIGIVMIFGGIATLSLYFSGFENSLETSVLGHGDGRAPSMIVSFLAGLLSFASPCVLPLVPAYLGYIGGWAVNSTAKNANE